MIATVSSPVRVLDLRGRKPDKVREDVRALVGRSVRVVYFKTPAERYPLPPVEGTVAEVHQHGFLVQARTREFIGYTDLCSRRARVEILG